MPRHDRPLGGTHVEHIGEEIAGQQPVAPAAPDVQREGGVRSVAGSLAVPRMSASDAVRMPGMITPPRKWPSAVMQSNVVAVPKSTTIESRWNSWAAASVLRMRSAPTCSGSSTSSVIGKRERPSTTTGRTVVARSTASHSPCVTGGTTDATTAARTSWVDRPSCARYDVRVAAHSSGVREGVVVRRQWASRLSPRNSPTFVSVLLMLMARSMARRKYRRFNGLSPRLTGRPGSRMLWRLRPTEEPMAIPTAAISGVVTIAILSWLFRLARTPVPVLPDGSLLVRYGKWMIVVGVACGVLMPLALVTVAAAGPKPEGPHHFGGHLFVFSPPRWLVPP